MRNSTISLVKTVNIYLMHEGVKILRKDMKADNTHTHTHDVPSDSNSAIIIVSVNKNPEY